MPRFIGIAPHRNEQAASRERKGCSGRGAATLNAKPQASPKGLRHGFGVQVASVRVMRSA
jgi:hypothetical protein